MSTEREWAVQVGDTSTYFAAQSEIHAADIAAEQNVAEIKRIHEFMAREEKKLSANSEYTVVKPTRTVYRVVTRPKPSAWTRDIFDR